MWLPKRIVAPVGWMVRVVVEIDEVVLFADFSQSVVLIYVAAEAASFPLIAFR